MQLRQQYPDVVLMTVRFTMTSKLSRQRIITQTAYDGPASIRLKLESPIHRQQLDDKPLIAQRSLKADFAQQLAGFVSF